MTYGVTSPRIGTQPIANTETSAKCPLGTVIRAVDPTYGEGEFIYLLGVANTTVGSVVSYDPSTYQTALAPVGTNLPRPIGVAMSANVASQYGWYQISGVAVMAKSSATSLAASAAVGVKTIGFIAASGSGKELQGAIVAAVASAASGRTTVKVMINRPHMQGRIT
ncbi:MAG TPA: hypothetical protein VIY48_03230 [Candidatus Paceibacterota bacterium]